VVLGGCGVDFSTIEAGEQPVTSGEQLQVSGLAVELGEAKVWEPRPDWAGLRGRRGVVKAGLPMLRALALDRAQAGSLMDLLGGAAAKGGVWERAHAAARRGLDALDVGWRGDAARLRMGVAQMAGLGSGLTPAGDDFLCGMMVWAWLTLSAPASLCCAIATIAAPRTTGLSAAFLGAAAKGQCDAAWHRLLKALARGDDDGMRRAAQDVLAQGASSGADALAGFLWAGERIELD
jgi:hypothetical protein